MVCSTCSPSEKKYRGCAKPAQIQINVDDVLHDREWGDDVLFEEAKRMDVDPDENAATFLYDYANIGHISDRWGFGFWKMCPASYIRFNPSNTPMYARLAVEAAEWIDTGVPQYALDGDIPSAAMGDLIQFVLNYWKLEKIDSKIKALEDNRTNIRVGK